MSENKYITELEVSQNRTEEMRLSDYGFTRINVNLNQGAGGDEIYLWYLKGSIQPITRMQLTFSDDMAPGLSEAGYTKIDKNLNAGTDGDKIYLWYIRGETEYDVPIVGLDVPTGPYDDGKKFVSGWERLSCNLNRGAGGSFLYLNVKRGKPVYIQDVTVTETSDDSYMLFKEGWIRADENIKKGTPEPPTFIWYRLATKTEGAIRALKISTNRQEEEICSGQGYKKGETNLTKGTQVGDSFLWSKKDGDDDFIKGVTIINDTLGESKAFEQVGVYVFPIISAAEPMCLGFHL